MKEHDLKTWPEPFQAVLDGIKHHEIRIDDRGYAVGDVLRLREFRVDVSLGVYSEGEYTGRARRVRVTYKTPGGAWGLPGNLCVMSIEPADVAARVEGES